MLDGWLSLSKSLKDGQTQIIDFALPGDFLDVASADGTICGFNVEAITDVTVAVVSVAEWENLIQKSPAAHGVYMKAAAAARMRISERMLRLGKGSAEKRVAYALLELCTRIHATDQFVTGSFHVPLRQQQFGDFVGLSSVHVCRSLRRFVRQNIISMRDHMDINIIDAVQL